MADVRNIKIGASDPDAVMYDKYMVGKANESIVFGSFISKDNTSLASNAVSQSVWQVNDGWEVEIVGPKRLAVKKFRIDTWGLRQIIGNPHTDPNYNSFKIGVEGLEYVHENVVCHTSGSDTPDGFTKAYAGSGGYNVYWYPGQFTSGSYIQGLGVQFGLGYQASDNERDDSLQMGKHPWDVGSRSVITDGIVTGTWGDTSYKAITIGLYGGVQNASKWHDETGEAYRQYDISDHPIYIILDVDDTMAPVDPTSVECWDAYRGDTPVWHKDRTVDNCWKKYNLLIPDKLTLTASTLTVSAGSVEWLSPLRFRIKGTSDVTLQTDLIKVSANYTNIDLPGFTVRINGLGDGKATFERPTYNVTPSGKSYTLADGDTVVEAWTGVLNRQSSATGDIEYRHGRFKFTGLTGSAVTVEIVPVYDDEMLLKIETSSWSSILSNVKVPQVTDLESVIERTKFRMKAGDSSVWDNIKKWYEDNIGVNDNFRDGKVFQYSNLDSITLRIPNNSFQHGEDNLNNSSVRKVTFVQTGSKSHFSSPQGLLRSAVNLEAIDIVWYDSDNPDYIFGANSIADGISSTKLSTYPERLVNWAANRTNIVSQTINCTLFQYAFNNSPNLVTIPSYPGSDDENTIIPADYTERSFYGCPKLETIGPVIDMCLVQPKSASNMFHNCVKLSSARIRNLNHGDWSLDGETRDSLYIGTLKSLDSDSVKYLFGNLADLTTHDGEKHEDTIDKSFKNWSTSYADSVYKSFDWEYAMTSLRQFTCRKAYSSGAPVIVSTTSALSGMKVSVSGLQEGDSVTFGTADTALVTWTSDGEKEITKDSGTSMGFRLSGSKASSASPVTITIVNGLDNTNPRVASASLYCPSEWSDKITSDMITSANTKGWSVYIGGTLAEITN